jgi:hypothetical protein
MMRVPSRRVLVIGIGSLLVIAGVIAATTLSPKKQIAVKESDKIVFDQTVNRVFIKDFHKYTDYFPLDKQQAIESALYGYVGRDTPDLYTGTIRPNSLLQTKSRGSAIEAKILVDVVPANVTYLLESSGEDKYGIFPIIVRCAPKEQQKNPSVSCSDGMQSRGE